MRTDDLNNDILSIHKLEKDIENCNKEIEKRTKIVNETELVKGDDLSTVIKNNKRRAIQMNAVFERLLFEKNKEIAKQKINSLRLKLDDEIDN